MLFSTIRLKKNIVLIKPVNSKTNDVKELIEEIRAYISSNNCHNVILDLSMLNFLNSIRVGALISTYHFIEFISGKIYLVVQDKQAKKMLEKLNISNAVVIYNQHRLALNNIA